MGNAETADPNSELERRIGVAVIPKLLVYRQCPMSLFGFGPESGSFNAQPQAPAGEAKTRFVAGCELVESEGLTSRHWSVRPRLSGNRRLLPRAPNQKRFVVRLLDLLNQIVAFGVPPISTAPMAVTINRQVNSAKMTFMFLPAEISKVYGAGKEYAGKTYVVSTPANAKLPVEK